MDMTFENLSKILAGKLALYQSLTQLLEDEKKYIIAMDIDGLWDAVNRKNNLAAAIQSIKEQLTDQATSGDATKSGDTTTSGDATKSGAVTMGDGTITKMIARAPLPLDQKTALKTYHCRIDACKREIAVKAAQNKQYLTQYLSVIDGVFSTVFNFATEKQYSHCGRVSPAEARPNLIRTEV
ncbi:MAG: flagellar protein FlgN [Desulfobacteraceae bacterium]|nr:flagellar protein FlgN [Desulfobacteraceae bacterium]